MTFDIVQLCDINIDVIDGDRGKNYPHQDELLEAGHCLFLSAKNVTQNGFLFADNQFITQEKDELLNNGKLMRGDIVITTRGTVGNVAIYSDEVPYDNIRINSGMLIIRCGDKIDNYYLYQVLRSKWFYNQILSIQSGSAQPQLPKSHFLKMTIPMPNMNTQHKIAGVLSSIGNKISVNTAINENLEQQAQAYFVDLFITSADPNWRIGTISDLGNVIGGGTPSKKVEEYYTSDGIAWITPKDLSNDKSKFVAHGETDITELGLAKSSATLMPKGTVLFSSRAPIGYIAIADGQVCTNQGFKSIVPFDNVGTAFVYYFLKENLSAIENVASGSTFKEVSGSTMKNFTAIIPDNDTLAEFQRFCSPLFEQQRALEYENRYLSSIRDTLLPKLMNGEIDVSAVKI